MTTKIQSEVEELLRETEPDVEVLLAEVVGGKVARVFIDHPDGVSLDLCERVTHLLPAIREQYALEVSSPGIERPLSKPEHFRRYVGRRAKVRTAAGVDPAQPARRSYSGELMDATDDGVTIAADSGVVTIAYADIQRSNLLGD